MRKIVKNGTVVTALDEVAADIVIEGGKITAIGRDLPVDGAEVIDAGGMYVLPGGVDQHTHFSFQYKDARVRGFETSNAAALGGTTTVIDFVNQKRGKSVIDSIREYDAEEVKGTAMVDYAFHGIVFEASDAVFKEIETLPEFGLTTLKLFMAYKGFPYHCDDEAIFKALKAAKKAGVTIMVHAENADVIDVLQKELLAEGKTGPYILYQAVRIKSLLRKAGMIDETAPFVLQDGDRALALLMTQLPEVFGIALKNYTPHVLCEYAHRLAQEFSSFYGNCHILSEADAALKASRLQLCRMALAQLVLLTSLMGIEIPERM